MVTREEVIRRKFGEFYEKNSQNMAYPTHIEEREFGFLIFKEGAMTRHKSFKNHSELGEFIRKLVPSDVYYSTAYYQRPEDIMEKKGWKGADLCFDIDADHLNTQCKKTHDSWKCIKCGEGGFGEAPKKCPKCKEQRFEEKNWFCDRCLEASKRETMKLLDVLITDFDLHPPQLDVCFSGHRGFHVHVEDERVISLDQLARKEIVDYIMGSGINLNYYGFPKDNVQGHILTNLDSRVPGWRSRIIKYVYEYLLDANEDKLGQIKGVRKSEIETFIKDKEDILANLINKAILKTFEGLNIKIWKKIVESALKANTINIDTVVTIDIHRLIRLPSTLHRKTGFKVVVIPVEKLETFDPFTDAIAFKEGSMKVRVSEAQKFELAKTEYGPYKDEVVELPMAVAILLLCKGLADPV